MLPSTIAQKARFQLGKVHSSIMRTTGSGCKTRNSHQGVSCSILMPLDSPRVISCSCYHSSCFRPYVTTAALDVATSATSTQRLRNIRISASSATNFRTRNKSTVATSSATTISTPKAATAPLRTSSSATTGYDDDDHSSAKEYASFPISPSSSSLDDIEERETVLLNSKQHAVGYLGKILNARVYDVAIETQLQYAPSLSKDLNNTILLKREDTQPVFSFKIRGAYNKMSQIDSAQNPNGVVACSAGNHAQGVALSARMLRIKATIVMPVATPTIKVRSVQAHGGDEGFVTVKLHGDTYDEAAVEAKRLVVEEGMEMIHPFDDPYVIAGQGTIGVEILKECVGRPLDIIFVCCGGGGMLAGIAAYVKRVRPTTRVIGVEAADAAGMTASINAGKVVTLDSVGLFADGAAVKTIGTETFRVCSTLVDDMVTVDTDQICNAIKMTYNDARVILEPAGALAVAGMKKYVEEHNITGQTMVAITSGANMDFDRLRFVSELADDSERTLAITIPETPGAFRRLYSLIWPRNVTMFSYRFESKRGARILISFQPVSNVDNDFESVLNGLREEEGFDCLDVSYNELAKIHVRHFVGGRADLEKERLFRFEFPESPGALQRFLHSLDMDWNISLFHYRNHGDNFGRVLVGIQVGNRCERLHLFLDNLGYEYTEETNNPAYHNFLRKTG